LGKYFNLRFQFFLSIDKMATNPTPLRTKADLPPPSSKKAPTIFTGHYAEVDTFLKEFVLMADAYNLTNADRFETILRYVSRPVKEVIEGLHEYTIKDWSKFEDNLRQLYNHAKMEKRYKEKDLKTFIDKHKLKPIRSIYNFNDYQRKFTRIGGWLYENNKITHEQHLRYFWKGIDKSSRRRLENRMFQNNPQLSLSAPFPLTDITTAANHIWNMNRFDDDTSDDDDERSSSDEVSDTEEEEVMARRLKKEKKKQKKETKTKRSKPDNPVSTPADLEQQEADEIAELIDKLGKLDIKDPSYPAMYFRVIKRAELMAPFIKMPFLKEPPTQQAEVQTRPSHTGPIHAPAASTHSTQSTGSSTCYFCGGTGHGVRRCALCENMIAAGTVVRNDQGRVTWPDGTNIPRGFNETILSAVNRELASRTKSTNLIRTSTTTLEEDVEAKKDYIIHNGQIFVAVKKDSKLQKKDAHVEPKRRMLFDGIRVPQIPATTSKPMDPVIQEPRLVHPPPLATYEQPPVPFNISDDDEFMEDVFTDSSNDSTTFPLKKPLKKSQPPPKPNKKTPIDPGKTKEPIPDGSAVKKDAAPKQQTELQRSLDLESLVDKVLATPTTITLRDLLGASPTASKKVADYLRITRPSKFIRQEEPVKDVAPVGTQVNIVKDSEYHKQDAKLIKLQLCFSNGHKEDALIDPGSEMDIMNQETWIKSQVPMTYTTRAAMRDAGDHITSLDGLCDNLTLTAGNLVTTSNFWVGDVPFPLLCGRPWQRRNKVNVEERNTGTWLVHRDHFDTKLWELCAVPSKQSMDANSDPYDFFRKGHQHVHKTTIEEVTDNDT